MVIATTKTIAKLPHLTTFLTENPRAVVGWGRKPSGHRAVWLAKILRRRVALVEDGFIRSVDRFSSPLSLLVDDLGVYYDAKKPSRMERSIRDGADTVQAERARLLAAQWRASGISKYNHAPNHSEILPSRYVLVADQTFGDLSISGGLATHGSFSAMLSAALNENPQETIVVKVHPDVHSKAKQGCFVASQLLHPRIVVVGSECHCANLINMAQSVYCVTSLIGFEALLWQKPVRCFGMPFYAGWGLTEDELGSPSRRNRARLHDIVHAALVDVARYAEPVRGAAWTAEEAIEYVARGRSALLARRQSPIIA